ncbi:MAG: hypothetical protein K6E29_06905 [Cyanobacteria bacterium RUI128]|nr:hypothetical protein [Cyanobacteria bacterium RUI128]
MVSSANYSISITQGHGSSVAGVGVVRYNQKKDDKPAKVVNIPDAKIKYRKIKQSDKYIVHGDWNEEYCITEEIQTSAKEIEKNIELMSRYRLIKFNIPSKKILKYLKDCYKIDSIEAPVRYQGAGAKAVQSVLDRSLADKDTQGRIVLYAEITDGKTSPAGFFYKLGFRFIDKSMNEVMEAWVRKNIEAEAPLLTGMMYLPKNHINKVMMYGRNLL